jgi:hypothetical protein
MRVASLVHAALHPCTGRAILINHSEQELKPGPLFLTRNREDHECLATNMITQHPSDHQNPYSPIQTSFGYRDR